MGYFVILIRLVAFDTELYLFFSIAPVYGVVKYSKIGPYENSSTFMKFNITCINV